MNEKYFKLGYKSNPFDPLGIPRSGIYVGDAELKDKITVWARKVVREGDPAVLIVSGGLGYGKTTILRSVEEAADNGSLVPGYRLVAVYVQSPTGEKPFEEIYEMLEDEITTKLKSLGVNLQNARNWPITPIMVRSRLSGSRYVLESKTGEISSSPRLMFRKLSDLVREAGLDGVLIIIDDLEVRLEGRIGDEVAVELEKIRILLDSLYGPVFLIVAVDTRYSSLLEKIGRNLRLTRRIPLWSIYELRTLTYPEFKRVIAERLRSFRERESKDPIHPFTEDAVKTLYDVYISVDGDMGRVMQVANITFYKAAVEGRPIITREDILKASSIEELRSAGVERIPRLSEIPPSRVEYKLSKIMGGLTETDQGEFYTTIKGLNGIPSLKVYLYIPGVTRRPPNDKYDLLLILSEKPPGEEGPKELWIRLTLKSLFLLSSPDENSAEVERELSIMDRIDEWSRNMIRQGYIIPHVGYQRGLRKLVITLIEYGGEVGIETLHSVLSHDLSQRISPSQTDKLLRILREMNLVSWEDGKVRLKSSEPLRRMYKLVSEEGLSKTSEIRKHFIATSSKTISWYLDILRNLRVIDGEKRGNIVEYKPVDVKALLKKCKDFVSSHSSLLTPEEKRLVRGVLGEEDFTSDDPVETGIRLRGVLDAIERLEEKVKVREECRERLRRIGAKLDEIKRRISRIPIFTPESNVVVWLKEFEREYSRAKKTPLSKLDEVDIEEMEGVVQLLESRISEDERMDRIVRYFVRAFKRVAPEVEAQDSQKLLDYVEEAYQSGKVRDAYELIEVLPEDLKSKILGEQAFRVYRKLTWIRALERALPAEYGGKYEEFNSLIVKKFVIGDVSEKIAELSKIEEEIDETIDMMVERVAGAFKAIGAGRLRLEKLAQHLSLTTFEAAEVVSILALMGKVKLTASISK